MNGNLLVSRNIVVGHMDTEGNGKGTDSIYIYIFIKDLLYTLYTIYYRLGG